AFSYASGVFVHPFMLEAIMVREHTVGEYQIRQSLNGLSVLISGTGNFNQEKLVESFVALLTRLGMSAPNVTVTRTEAIERGATGKFLRFTPLNLVKETTARPRQ